MHYALHILLHGFALWSFLHCGNAAKILSNPEILTNFAKNVATALSPTLLEKSPSNRTHRSVNDFVLSTTTIKEINDNQISSTPAINPDNEAKAQQNYVNQIQPYHYERSYQYTIPPFSEHRATEYYSRQNGPETSHQFHTDYYNSQNYQSQIPTTSNGLTRVDGSANSGDNFANGANPGTNIVNNPNNNAPVQQRPFDARPFVQGQTEASPAPFGRSTLNIDLNSQFPRFPDNNFQRIRDNIQQGPIGNGREFYGPPNLPGTPGLNPSISYQPPFSGNGPSGYNYPDQNGPYPSGQPFGQSGGVNDQSNTLNSPYPSGQPLGQSGNENNQSNTRGNGPEITPSISTGPYTGSGIEPGAGSYNGPNIGPSYGPPISGTPFGNGPNIGPGNGPYNGPGIGFNYGPPLNNGPFGGIGSNNGLPTGNGPFNNGPQIEPNNRPVLGISIGGPPGLPPLSTNGSPQPRDNQQPLGERFSSPFAGSFQLEGFPPSSFRLLQTDQFNNVFSNNFTNIPFPNRSANLRGAANTYLPPAPSGASAAQGSNGVESKPEIGPGTPASFAGESTPTPLNQYGPPTVTTPQNGSSANAVAAAEAAAGEVSSLKDDVETVSPIENDTSRASSSLKLKLFLPSREFYEKGKKLFGRILLTGSSNEN